MKIAETLKQISELQQLIGTNIPGTHLIIDDIIPAPDDNQLYDFIKIYLKTESLSNAIQTLNIKSFEILLLADSKKKGIFDTKTTISNTWYKDYY